MDLLKKIKRTEDKLSALKQEYKEIIIKDNEDVTKSQVEALLSSAFIRFTHSYTILITRFITVRRSINGNTMSYTAPINFQCETEEIEVKVARSGLVLTSILFRSNSLLLLSLEEASKRYSKPFPLKYYTTLKESVVSATEEQYANLKAFYDCSRKPLEPVVKTKEDDDETSDTDWLSND